MATITLFGRLLQAPLQGKPLTAPPDRILVLKDGDVDIKGWEGISLDRKQATAMIAAFQLHGADLPIDYEHSTVDLDREGKAKAAGWITGLAYVAGEGLYAAVRWNKTAAAEIMAEEYRYFSPVVTTKVSSSGVEKMTQLSSLALTNKPATRGLHGLLAASELERAFMATKRRKPKTKKKGLRELIGATLKAQEDEELEEEEFPEVGSDGDAIASLLARMQEMGSDLADNASVASIIEAALSHLAVEDEDDEERTEEEEEAKAKAAADAAAKAAGVGATGIKDLAAKVAVLTVKAAKYDEAAKGLAELQKDKADTRVASLMSEQVKAGKINPNDEKQFKAAEVLARSDEDAFAELMGSLVPTYPVDGKTKDRPGGNAPSGSRAKCIKTAKESYADDPTQAYGASERFWIDAMLEGDNHNALTANEVSSLTGKEA